MMRLNARRAAIVLLIVAAAGCGYDASGVQGYDPPPSAPPPAPADGPNAGLWVASGSRSIASLLRLSPAQLLAGGSVAAATEINTASASLFTVNNIAFDDAGNMWIASAEDSLLLLYTPGALGASGLSAARAVILPTERSLSAPTGIAFDRQHRLWVANFETGTLVRFDPAQLVVTGRPAPAVIIDGLDHPVGLAFDASGALWVASSTANHIVKFSADQLEASGHVTPRVVLSATQGSLQNPFALAFDARGNLWVSNIGSRTMTEFSAAQLAATGAPLPRTRLTSSALPPVGIPLGLAFDGDGSLWVLGGGGALEKFGAADLLAGGARAPAVRLGVTDHSALSGLAFFPKPRGLPLN